MLLQFTSGLCLPLSAAALRPAFVVRKVSSLYVSPIEEPQFHAELTSTVHVDVRWFCDDLGGAAKAEVPVRGRAKGAQPEAEKESSNVIGTRMDAATINVGAKSIGEFVGSLTAEQREFVVTSIRQLDKYGQGFRAPAPAVASNDPIASLLPTGGAEENVDYVRRYRNRTASMQKFLRDHKLTGSTKSGRLDSAEAVVAFLKANGVHFSEGDLIARITELPILRTYSATGIVSFAAPEDGYDEVPRAQAQSAAMNPDDEDAVDDEAAA